MSQINLKSISGITSITTPTGVDNQLTLHNNNTTEAVKLDTAGNLHFHNHLNITGISTASNFKTGTSNLHNTGLNVQDLDVDGHTNLDNVSIAGITTLSTGINMNAASSNLYLTDGALSYFHPNNGVYLNGAGANGWLRLQAAGTANDRTSINLNGHTASGGDSIHFRTNSTERLRITSTGSVGIGTNNPDVGNTAYPVVQVHGTSTNAYFKLTNTTTGVGSGDGVELSLSGSDAYLTNRESANIIFRTGGSNERLRIDSSGRLLISTTSAGEADSSADDLVIGNTSSGNSGLTIVTGTGNNGALFFADSGGTVRGGFRYQHSSDVLQFYSGGSVSLQVKSNGIGLHENYPVANSLTIRGAATDDTPLLVLKRHTDGAQSDGEIIGKIQFMSNENNVDSGNHQPRAEIHGVTVNTSGAAKMDFYTVPNSTTTPVKAMTINQLGQVTKPNHPSFCARWNSGNGFVNTDILCLTRMSGWHSWNSGSYSTSTGKFTAPVDGVYYFEAQAMTTGHSDGDNIQDMMSLDSNRGRISWCRQRQTYFRSDENANGYFTNSVGGSIKLNANDTVWFQRRNGLTWGFSNQYYTYFTGWLIG